MQWLNTLSWWQWAALAAVPAAVVALYFLKLKRRPVEVPSTYLWSKAIEDLHVNSLWQKLRHNLLLFLQLLVLLLVAVALLRPGWRANELKGERLIFLIDNSASMNAADVQPTRLADAKRQIATMIDAMTSGQRAMLISFADTAHVEQGLTEKRRELRTALDRIQPTNRSTSLLDALKVAAGLANPGSLRDQQAVDELRATLYIFSDGKFPDVQGFSLGNLDPLFVPVGRADAANIGIVAFSTRPSEKQPDRLQAFGRLENSGPQPVKAVAELYLGNELIDAAAVTIPERGGTGVVFDLSQIESGILRLKVPRTDLLMLDNVAWAAVNRPQRANVLLVSSGTNELRKALGTEEAAEIADVSIAQPQILPAAEHRQQAASGMFDLIIYDQCRPTEMPRANTLFFGELPLAGWTAEPPLIGPQIIDVHRTHPLMENVDLADVEIYEGRTLTPPSGGSRLVESSRGALVAIGPREGFEDAVVGFGFTARGPDNQPIANTTWAIRQSFPVFVLNAIRYLGGRVDLAATASVRPGQPIALQTRGGSEPLSVSTPGGATINVPATSASGPIRFSQTDKLGPYAVKRGKDIVEQFAVNLFDSSESNIPARDQTALTIGHTVVEPQAAWQPARRELWKWVLILGLAVVMAEWYIYNHRVYV